MVVPVNRYSSFFIRHSSVLRPSSFVIRSEPAMPAASTSADRMPAEWEPHRATWLAWPHHAADWPGKFAAIPWVYAEIIRHLTQSETVCLLVADGKMEERVRRVLRKAGVSFGRVDFYQVPTDRVWTRDYCPLFVVNA